MAKAKKLKSGNWRCLVYSHTDSEGKRHYESFTAPTKKEAQYMAAEFTMQRNRMKDSRNWTLGEAVDKYIELKRPVLSPTTISRYESVRSHAFQALMNIPLRKLTSNMLQNAINDEINRKPADKRTTALSPKTVRNNYGLIASTLKRYCPDQHFAVDLPKKARRIRTLPLPEDVYKAVYGTDIELPVLLAMWLSFTMSEIRGLTKSKSIDGNYITIREVLVNVEGVDVRKDLAKEVTRNRRHRMPEYIKNLIDQVDGDIIVPYTPSQLYKKLQKALRASDVPLISFHDLRHINASLMAMLQIPDKYAQERGGWKTDHIMKSVYTETFSEERKRVDNVIDDYFMSRLQ